MLWNKAVAQLRRAAASRRGWSALDLRDTKTGEIERLDVEGAFVAIGHSPATELFTRQARRSTRTAISRSRPARTRTSVPGVFACGDVMDKIYRQAVTAAGTGCMAALDAEKFLAEADFEARAAAARFRRPERVVLRRMRSALSASATLVAASSAVVAGASEGVRIGCRSPARPGSARRRRRRVELMRRRAIAVASPRAEDQLGRERGCARAAPGDLARPGCRPARENDPAKASEQLP